MSGSFVPMDQSASQNQMSEEDFANLSDDEIMNMAVPPAFSTQEEEAVTQDADTFQGDVSGEGLDEEIDTESDVESEQEKLEDNADDADVLGDPDENEEPSEAPAEDDVEGESATIDDGSKAATEAETSEPAPAEDAPEDTSEDEEDAEDAEKTNEIDYKAFYEAVFAPFKANGKKVEVTNPEEAVRLMQMGANYSKKMSALAPHLKLVRMLENQNLLDENRLSYLIDLSKGDKSAVQKLVKESGIDPMDIDVEKDASYSPGNYSVSDEEMTFRSVLEDVVSDPAGQEVVSTINQTWDAASKKKLWAEPEMMRVLQTQKNNGMFDKIEAEIERRQIFGQLGGMSRLDAYYTVGTEMTQAGLLRAPESTSRPTPSAQNQATSAALAAPATPAEAAPVAQRVATRRSSASNDAAAARVKAASPMKTSPKKVQSDFNPLALSDDEFEKHASMGARF